MLRYLSLNHRGHFLFSLRSWRWVRRLKFWRRSRVPKKGSRDEAVKSHSTILQRLRRQISLDYYTIPPAMQAIFCCDIFSLLFLGHTSIPHHTGLKPVIIFLSAICIPSTSVVVRMSHIFKTMLFRSFTRACLNEFP